MNIVSEPSRQTALIACASQNLSHSAKARELYTSTLVQLNLQNAHCRRVVEIKVLFAKYGLLDPDRVIEPYNMTLNTMSTAEVKRWSDRVLIQEREGFDLQQHFIFLAGIKYRKYLAPRMKLKSADTLKTFFESYNLLETIPNDRTNPHATR